MPESEKQQALEAAVQVIVAAIDRRIEELIHAKETVLNAVAATTATVPMSLNSDSGVPATARGGDPLGLVGPQEFFGLPSGQAAIAFLKRVGAPQHTRTILAALQKGGWQYKGKAPEGALYTMLKRHLSFVYTGKGYWDLAERRPHLAEQQRASKGRTRPQRKRRLKAKATTKPATKNGQEQERPMASTLNIKA